MLFISMLRLHLVVATLITCGLARDYFPHGNTGIFTHCNTTADATSVIKGTTDLIIKTYLNITYTIWSPKFTNEPGIVSTSSLRGTLTFTLTTPAANPTSSHPEQALPELRRGLQYRRSITTVIVEGYSSPTPLPTSTQETAAISGTTTSFGGSTVIVASTEAISSTTAATKTPSLPSYPPPPPTTAPSFTTVGSTSTRSSSASSTAGISNATSVTGVTGTAAPGSTLSGLTVPPIGSETTAQPAAKPTQKSSGRQTLSAFPAFSKMLMMATTLLSLVVPIFFAT